MSVKSKTKAKTTKKIKTTTPKQQFIRLNLDEKLDEILNFYQQKYTLLSKPEIVRMLLNEGDWKLKNSNKNTADQSKPSFKQILSNSDFLDIQEEEEQFAFVKKNFGV